MSEKKAPFIVPKRHKNRTLEDSFHNLTGQEEIIKLINFEYLVPNNNPYPITELEDLIESIKLYGVEQNLIVKKVNEYEYLIIGGHRRYFAVKFILENDKEGNYEYLQQLYCKIVKDDIDELIIRLRLHESNLQTRPLLKMEENEKLKIIEEYLDLIKQAREKGLKLYGKEIKGKTRDILANAFNISGGTAQTLIEKVNQKEKSTKIGTTSKKVKTASDELRTIIKKIEKLEFEDTEEEQTLKEEIKRILNL